MSYILKLVGLLCLSTILGLIAGMIIIGITDKIDWWLDDRKAEKKRRENQKKIIDEAHRQLKKEYFEKYKEKCTEANKKVGTDTLESMESSQLLIDRYLQNAASDIENARFNIKEMGKMDISLEGKFSSVIADIRALQKTVESWVIDGEGEQN